MCRNFRRSGRKTLSSVLVGIMVFVLFLGFTETVFAEPPSGSTWIQTFNDDFNGSSLDTTKWDPNGWGLPANDSELQGYSPSYINVHDGACWIGVDKVGMWYKNSSNQDVWKNYTAGFMTTEDKWTQRYGYFEARCQLPKGRGMWPAFWTVADVNHPSPTGGTVWPPEVDIMESVGCSSNTSQYYTNNGNLFWSNNYPDAGGGVAGVYTGSHTYSFDLTADYHTYGVDWEPTYMTFYTDGIPINTFTDHTAFNNPQYMILNLALDPGTAPDANTVFPAYLKVDYVKCWQKSGGGGGGTTLSKPGIGSEYNPIYGGQWAGESFVAQGSSISQISLWMLQANNADITVEIRSGSINGTILGSTTITSRSAGKVTANFGTPVNVTNGTTYYLKAIMNSGSAGRVQQCSPDSSIQGYYEGGTSSADMAFELVFGGSGGGGTTLSKPGIGSEYNPLYGGRWAGESFAAQGSKISQVSLWMLQANNADIAVEIRSGSINGTILGSTTITSRSEGKVTANFGTPVNVTNGTTYYLKVIMNSGSAGTVQQCNQDGSIQGYYEGGTSSADMAFELVFN